MLSKYVAFKVINCTWLDWLSKEYVVMQDIWKLEKNIAFGQGLFTLTEIA